MMRLINNIGLLAVSASLLLFTGCQKRAFDTPVNPEEGANGQKPVEMIELEHPIVIGVGVLPTQVVDLNQPNNSARSLRADGGYNYQESDFYKSTVNRVNPAEVINGSDGKYAEVGDDWIRSITLVGLFANGDKVVFKQGKGKDFDYEAQGMVGEPLASYDAEPFEPWIYNGESKRPLTSDGVLLIIKRWPKDMPQSLAILANTEVVQVDDNHQRKIGYLDGVKNNTLTAFPSTPAYQLGTNELDFFKSRAAGQGVEAKVVDHESIIVPTNIPMYGMINDCRISYDFKLLGRQWGQTETNVVDWIYLERAVSKVEVTFDRYQSTTSPNYIDTNKHGSDVREYFYWLDDVLPGKFINVISVAPGRYQEDIASKAKSQLTNQYLNPYVPFMWTKHGINFIVKPDPNVRSQEEIDWINKVHQYDNVKGAFLNPNLDVKDRYYSILNPIFDVYTERHIGMYFPENYQLEGDDSHNYESTIRIGISRLHTVVKSAGRDDYEYAIGDDGKWQKNIKILEIVVGEKNAQGYHELRRNTFYKLHIRLSDVLNGKFKVLPYRIVDMDVEVDPDADSNEVHDWVVPTSNPSSGN